MRRKTFDALLSVGGLAIAVVLLVAGGLLTWANTFVNHQVRTQLAQQQIYFPPKGNAALAPKEIGPYLNKYAGKQLLTGAQAAATRAAWGAAAKGSDRQRARDQSQRFSRVTNAPSPSTFSSKRELPIRSRRRRQVDCIRRADGRTLCALTV